MVLVILGILLAIAVVTYVGFKERAANNAAKANLRAAVPAAESYFSSNGTYVGMSDAALRAIDGGLSTTLRVTAAAAGAYTICDDPSGRAWQLVGPGGGSGGFTAIGSC